MVLTTSKLEYEIRKRPIKIIAIQPENWVQVILHHRAFKFMAAWPKGNSSNLGRKACNTGVVVFFQNSGYLSENRAIIL